MSIRRLSGTGNSRGSTSRTEGNEDAAYEPRVQQVAGPTPIVRTVEGAGHHRRPVDPGERFLRGRLQSQRNQLVLRERRRKKSHEVSTRGAGSVSAGALHADAGPL